MRYQSLRSIINRLNSNPAPPVVIQELPELNFFSGPPENYVWPSCEVVNWPDASTILIVSAPGAVGKSAAAQAMAAELKWPVMASERAQVGGHSLSGLIHDSLGMTTSYVQEIALGRGGILIDALDEALFRAGTVNFEAFLKNVVAVSGSGLPDREAPPSVVILSRPDTASLAQLILETEGAAVATITLSFFGHTEAKQYISSYMRGRFAATRRPEYNADQSHPQPFSKLLKSRFDGIANLVAPGELYESNWQRVSDFLGYAPVLSVIAESVAITNPAAKHHTLRTQERTNLLGDIVRTILEREQSKIESGLRDKLRALQYCDNDADIPPLYTAEEQIWRLLSKIVPGIKLPTEMPPRLPRELRSDYEQAIDGFLPDHPFLRGNCFASAVFADYCYSRLVAGAYATLTQLPHTRITEAVGPFFARFAAEATTGVALSESWVPSLVKSWGLEAELTGTEGVAALSSWSSGTYLTLLQAAENYDCDFEIDNFSGVLVLESPVRDISVSGEICVQLGTSRSNEVIIGPRVFVAVEEVDVVAERLSVLPQSGKGNVLIFGGEVRADSLRAVDAKADDLVMMAASRELPPVLHRYLRDLPTAAQGLGPTAFTDLRAILMAFGRSVKGGALSVHADRMTRVIVWDKPERQSLLRDLMRRGVIRDSGELYHLELTELKSLGFDLLSLRRGELTDAMVRFLISVNAQR